MLRRGLFVLVQAIFSVAVLGPAHAAQVDNLTDQKLRFNFNCGDRIYGYQEVDPRTQVTVTCDPNDIPIGESLIPEIHNIEVLMSKHPDFDNSDFIRLAVIILDIKLIYKLFVVKRNVFKVVDQAGNVYGQEPIQYSMIPFDPLFKGDLEELFIKNMSNSPLSLSLWRKYGTWYSDQSSVYISPIPNPAVVIIPPGKAVKLLCNTCGRYFTASLGSGSSFTVKDGYGYAVRPDASHPGFLKIDVYPPPPPPPLAPPPPPPPVARCVTDHGYCDLDVLGHVTLGTVCHCLQFSGTVQ